jgi:hypothetical protein
MASVELWLDVIYKLTNDEARLIGLALTHTANDEAYKLSRSQDKEAMASLNNRLLELRKLKLLEAVKVTEAAQQRIAKAAEGGDAK